MGFSDVLVTSMLTHSEIFGWCQKAENDHYYLLSLLPSSMSCATDVSSRSVCMRIFKKENDFVSTHKIIVTTSR